MESKKTSKFCVLKLLFSHTQSIRNVDTNTYVADDWTLNSSCKFIFLFVIFFITASERLSVSGTNTTGDDFSSDGVRPDVCSVKYMYVFEGVSDVRVDISATKKCVFEYTIL